MTKLNAPVRRQADTMPAAHGVKSQLVLTLYPRGIIGIREAGRHISSEITLDASSLYVEGVKRQLAKKKHKK